MLRLLLLFILITFIARAFWRVMDGVIGGLRGGDAVGTPGGTRAVQMVRDPVCGTFVLPDRAVTLPAEGGHIYFCSAACRDAYQPRQRRWASRIDRMRGRSA